MAGLRVLGIDQITPKIIVESIVTLVLFSFATSGMFDLWKLLPTVFGEGHRVPDWWSIFLCLFPSLLFLFWLYRIYYMYRHILTPPPPLLTETQVTPHKGIIIALSAPRNTTPQEITERIHNCNNEENIHKLFEIWGIGQLFKGLYHHRDLLKYVWTLTTKASRPYEECIKLFLDKFVQSATICKSADFSDGYLLTAESDLDLIAQTKSFLSEIYSDENLSSIGLKKSDIVVDITGGLKSITIGLIFGALDSTIDIQYVEQRTEKYDVIPLSINHEIILDKTAEYLLELYSKINEIKKQRV